MTKMTSERISRVLLLCVAAASVLIAVLHVFGVLDNIPWVNHSIPVITLVATGLVGGYLAFEIPGKLDTMTGQIISAVGATQVRCFQNISEVQAYARERMIAARCVDDLTWGPRIYGGSPAHQEAYKRYRKDIAELGSRKDFLYREVMTFSDLLRVNMAEETMAKARRAYQLRYYDVPMEGAPPLMRFVLVNDEEVIFVHSRRPGIPDEGTTWVAVRHPDIVEMAKVYYAEVWNGARVVEPDTLQQARARLQSL